MPTKELYKQLMTYTPFKTGSVESYDEYLIRNRKEKIELIRQFKSEVCKKQREICANQYKDSHGYVHFKKEIMDLILNAPEP